MDFLDSYVVRARLFPAALAIAPAIVFALVNVGASYDDLGLPQTLITATVGVLFFAFADLARRFGRRAEQIMFASSGGRPFPAVLRHSDTTIDAKSKLRYHSFLAGVLDEKVPSKVSEANDPARADAFYVACGNWLRENTRDHDRFGLLFSENVVYGFRRNLFGLKWVGLVLNAITVLLSVWMITGTKGENLPQYGTVLIVAALHAVFFLFGVTRRSVLDASQQYGRQLVLSCESFLREAQQKA